MATTEAPALPPWAAPLVFVAGALLFSRGLIGGGDVKLLTAATLWAGPGLTPALLIVTALLGGLLTLALLSPLAMRAVFTPADAAPAPRSGCRCPTASRSPPPP